MRASPSGADQWHPSPHPQDPLPPYRRTSESTGGVFDVPVYVGASLEVGNTWDDRSDIRFESALVNGGLFVGFDTPIGPVYLGAGLAEGGRSNYYLFFGAPRRR